MSSDDPCEGAPTTLDANGVSWSQRCNLCQAKDGDDRTTCMETMMKEYAQFTEGEQQEEDSADSDPTLLSGCDMITGVGC